MREKHCDESHKYCRTVPTHECLLRLVRDGSLSRKGARGGRETTKSAPWPLHTRRQTLVSDIGISLRAISALVQCSNWDRYSMTSSASAKKFTGSSMPVAFAVLRLMTSL